MQIAFDTKTSDEILGKLEASPGNVLDIIRSDAVANISGAVSLHPGISQWGASQGAILGSGFGAAQKVVQSLADQTEWLHAAFRASVMALSGQNRFISRGMEIVDLGGEVGFEDVTFPTRPDLHSENFSFPTPFHSPKMRLASLVAEISSTNYGQIAATSKEWKQMSVRAAQAAGDLQKIAAQIQADATGDVFELAAERVGEVAAKLKNFSAHSMTIGASLDKDMAAMQAMQQQAVAAQTQVMAILSPMARIAAEKSAVAALNASFAATMPTLGPPINNLISSVMEGSKGGGTISTGMDALPATEGTKAKNLQQQATAGAQGAKAASVGTGSPEQAVAQAKNIGTNAANYLGTPSIPGLGAVSSLGTLGGWQGANMPAGLSGGAGYSGAAAGAAGAAGAFPGISRGGSMGVPSYLAGGAGAGKLSGVTGARAGITPGTMGTTAPSSKGVSVPGLGGASVGTSTPNSFSGAMPYSGLAGSQHTTGFNTNSLGKGGAAGIGGGRGIGSAGGVGGLGNRLAGGVGAGGPVGGIGGNGLGQAGVRGNAPQPSAAPVAGAGVGKGAAAAGAANAAGGRPAGMIGGAPMGAAAGAANSKTGKVKHVTSVVEHDANLKALLGEPTPVVPGVIGDWVRG